MFKFRDLLEMWQWENNGSNIFSMLQDYKLDSRLSRTLMNNQIMIRMGTLHPLYNDSAMMKFAIDNWFDEYDPIISDLLDLKDKFDDIDPFINVNWQEHYGGTRNDVNKEIENITRNDTENETIDKDTVRTEDITESNRTDDDTTSTSTTNMNNSTTNTISAYDSNGYQPQSKTDVTETTNVNTTTNEDITTSKTIDDDESIKESSKRNRTEKETDDKTNNFTGDRTEKHNLTHIGKEGVQSYASMLEEARDAVEFDIYDWILVRLERAVCLGVY